LTVVGQYDMQWQWPAKFIPKFDFVELRRNDVGLSLVNIYYKTSMIIPNGSTDTDGVSKISDFLNPENYG